VVASFAGHIFTIIIGRTLQGAGAVSGATLALAADLTRPEQRTKTMAIIGISIGLAFSLAFVLGPIIDAHFGLRGVFLGGALAGIGALGLVLFAVPEAPPMQAIVVTPAAATSGELRALYVGVLCLHLVLSASFVSIPLLLAHDLALPKTAHYTVYVPALLLSMLIVGPLIGRSHRGNLSNAAFPGAIACLVVAEYLLWLLPATRAGLIATLTLFFTGFNFLEASLPSMISRAAPASRKGAALGTYATGQFVGTFLGGLLGGAAASLFGSHGVFATAGSIALCWLLMSRHEAFALRALHRSGEP
jgi:MFS family permease